MTKQRNHENTNTFPEQKTAWESKKVELSLPCEETRQRKQRFGFNTLFLKSAIPNRNQDLELCRDVGHVHAGCPACVHIGARLALAQGLLGQGGQAGASAVRVALGRRVVVAVGAGTACGLIEGGACSLSFCPRGSPELAERTTARTERYAGCIGGGPRNGRRREGAAERADGGHASDIEHAGSSVRGRDQCAGAGHLLRRRSRLVHCAAGGWRCARQRCDEGCVVCAASVGLAGASNEPG